MMKRSSAALALLLSTALAVPGHALEGAGYGDLARTNGVVEAAPFLLIYNQKREAFELESAGLGKLERDRTALQGEVTSKSARVSAATAARTAIAGKITADQAQLASHRRVEKTTSDMAAVYKSQIGRQAKSVAALESQGRTIQRRIATITRALSGKGVSRASRSAMLAERSRLQRQSAQNGSRVSQASRQLASLRTGASRNALALTNARRNIGVVQARILAGRTSHTAAGRTLSAALAERNASTARLAALDGVHSGKRDLVLRLEREADEAFKIYKVELDKVSPPVVVAPPPPPPVVEVPPVVTPPASDPIPPPAVTPPVVTPEPEPAPAPEPLPPTAKDFETKEYVDTKFLGVIGASSKYVKGITGKGVRLGVMDTGILKDDPEFAGRLRTDLGIDFAAPDAAFDSHGTQVASVMAAGRDGRGIHGVAYEAEIVPYRAVGTGPGIRGRVREVYLNAMNNGVAALNHSWGYIKSDGVSYLERDFTGESIKTFLGPDQLGAMISASNAGVISVWATANDRQTSPSAMAALPKWYPELESHWLAVTALSYYDSENREKIASYANHCGAAKNWCLAAPGEVVASVGGQVLQTRGTSVATPQVTGALALLMQEFPELSSAQVRQVILDSARDIGEPGVDEVFGHGVLDLRNAVRPIGDLTVKMADTLGGGEVSASSSYIAGSEGVTSAFATSLASVDVALTDKFDRGYRIGMNAFVAETRRARDARTMLAGLGAGDAFALGDSGFARQISAGQAKLPVARGETSVELTSTMAETGSASRYFSATIGHDFEGAGSFSIGLGRASEKGAVLGARMGGAFAQDLSSETRFIEAQGHVPAGGETTLHGAIGLGSTSFSSSGMLTGGSNIRSMKLALGVSRKAVLSSDDEIGFSVARPLAITSGRIEVDRPVAMAAASSTGARVDRVERSREVIDLADAKAAPEFGFTYRKDVAGAEILGAIAVTPRTKQSSVAVGITFSF